MHFTSFCKRGFTIADPLYTDIPGNFYILTDGSLVCTKHPAKKSYVAIGPLAVGGGGLAGIPAAPAALPAGGWRGVACKLT
jgi:hypothetical protein